jgi:hypothetical protein
LELRVSNVRTNFARVSAYNSATVLFGFMIIKALFGVVLVGQLALLSFEIVEVDKYDYVIIKGWFW